MARLFVCAGAKAKGGDASSTGLRLLTPRGYLTGPTGFNDGTTYYCKNPDLYTTGGVGTKADHVMVYERGPGYPYVCTVASDGLTTTNHQPISPTSGGGTLEPRWDRFSGGTRIIATRDYGPSGTEQLELVQIVLNSGNWTDSPPNVTLTRLTTDGATRPSKYRAEAARDGKIWFSRGSDYNHTGISYYNPTTGTVTDVIAAPSDGSNPAFDSSLDRSQRYVVFGQGGLLYKYDTVAGTTTLLARPDSNSVALPRYSSETDQIFFIRQPSGGNNSLRSLEPSGAFRSWLALDAHVVDSFCVATLL